MDRVFEIINDDCIAAMKQMDAESVDAVVTDPPYGLAFMGKAWDHAVPGVEYWTECMRVLKPGGHLAAFGGTRLFHRLTCAIEDAGFEIRDCLMWVYATGFPKSHNLKGDWQGWGTALKPAWEPIVLARKPVKGTVAANVVEHGTGALNIDGCRVAGEKPSVPNPIFNSPTGRTYGFKTGEGRNGAMSDNSKGRWPANLVHDGSDDVVQHFPQNKSGSRKAGVRKSGIWNKARGDGGPAIQGSEGSAARFFYCAKASQSERNAGLNELPTQQVTGGGGTNNPEAGRIYGSMQTPGKNTHATVKPLALMRWLCRMVTPPNGLVLDPFCGSGSTLVAAMQEDFRAVGIEKEPEYADIARRRCEHEEW